MESVAAILTLEAMIEKGYSLYLWAYNKYYDIENIDKEKELLEKEVELLKTQQSIVEKEEQIITKLTELEKNK